MTLILSETLAPPRMATNGRSGFSSSARQDLDLALQEQPGVRRQEPATPRSRRARDGRCRRRR